MKTYELPMSRDYVRHWGLMEAVRELLQNALDSDSPFEYAFENDSLTITSRFSTLDARTLVLGATSKAGDDDKIGSFGEGYKIALLVLARLGKTVFVQNGSNMWRPCFRNSEQYGAEVFCIEEEPITEALYTGPGLEFMIADLSEAEQEAIRSSCLFMQPPMDDVIGAAQGSILPSRPGKLYVGGLFVCDTPLKFGYDVAPQHLRLERDRKTVDGFDLKWLAKDMWFSTQRWAEIAGMIEEQVPDFELAEHSAPIALRAACYDLFEQKSSGAIAIKTQVELDRLRSLGQHRTSFVGSGFHALVTSSAGYTATRVKVTARLTPAEQLDEWFQQNRKYLRRLPLVSFKALLAEAKGWIRP